MITVIHTFGRDLKFNPHIHVLVTEGAIEVQRLDWIPYEYLRKSWQKVVLDSMKLWYPENLAVQNIINELYKRYTKGFNVNAEKKMKNAKGAAKYIGEYLIRPAIAEYRIIGYDGKEVIFWYEDHQTGKRVTVKQLVFRFLYNLIQRIPPPKHSFPKYRETNNRKGYCAEYSRI
ncbi:transposase [Lysinibacillus sp. NPDC059133]|uniref:transposase n=1 Tax=Lysinibacillus sp. NPDC059133 TaxID=3346737 RepID=UPI0036B1357A